MTAPTTTMCLCVFFLEIIKGNRRQNKLSICVSVFASRFKFHNEIIRKINIHRILTGAFFPTLFVSFYSEPVYLNRLPPSFKFRIELWCSRRRSTPFTILLLNFILCHRRFKMLIKPIVAIDLFFLLRIFCIE